MVVGWLVGALCVAGDVGLVELEWGGGAAGWEGRHAHVLCLAGAASPEGERVWVCWEDGGVLAVGEGVPSWVGWAWTGTGVVVWVVGVVDGD